jgi:hypothetical protein
MAGLQALWTSDGSGVLGDGTAVTLPFDLTIESTLLLELLAVAAAVGIWFLLFAAVLASTRPADVDPLPAGADIPGDEPPAVVSLLAGRWKLNEDAAESTLIDLAARHWIELRQPGNDPTHTTVHLLRHPGGRPPKDPQPLTPYDEMVLARVRTEAVDHVVPITALTFRDLGEASAWTARLHKLVIDDARARGLTRRRFSPLLVTALSALAGLPAALLALVIMERSGEVGAGPGAGLISWALLSGLAGRPLGERDTPAGREAAARWLGLQRFLRNDEAFAELPPSAVTVWDRYLSYGDALGVTRVCSALIDLGMGDRKRVWSSFGGGWHRVRVSYPKFWGRYGATVPRVLIGAGGVLLVGFFLLKSFGSQGFDRPDSLNNALGDLPVMLGLYLVIRGLYRLARLAGDLLAPKTLSGEVLWVELWKSTAEKENKPSVPLVHYFAVDDGTGDRTTAWALPSDWSGRARPGDLVTITVRPWTRRVSKLVVDSSRAARLAEVANASGGAGSGAGAGVGSDGVGAPVGPGRSGPTVPVPVGPLGPVLPGLGGVLGPDGGAALSPVLASAALAGAVAAAHGDGVAAVPQLLSVDEVTTALGRAVISDGAAARVQLGPFELVTFSSPEDGTPVLVVALARGSAVGLVIRSVRRGGTALPGIGDEAWSGPGWALGRRGDTMIRLTLEQGNASALPALLARALSRL